MARLKRTLVELFPERHLYVRSGGQMKGYVLTRKKQMIAAGGVSAAALWMGVCSAAMLVNMLSAGSADREIARTQAKYERWIADRERTRHWYDEPMSRRVRRPSARTAPAR